MNHNKIVFTSHSLKYSYLINDKNRSIQVVKNKDVLNEAFTGFSCVLVS